MDSINNDSNLEKNEIIEFTETYSQIVDNRRDCSIVKILRKVLNGRNSEMTNFNTYLYQLFLINDKNSEIYRKFKDIINRNLLIIEHLGNAIWLFGANPKFVNSNCNFWTARNVKYDEDVNNFVINNIDREKKFNKHV